jgi:hypothetical protein
MYHLYWLKYSYSVFIIRDECTMAHRSGTEVLIHTLREINLLGTQ